ncbi:MAG: DUF503 domain-containing protein [Acidobacteriota bacterium]|jgi:uncharacterized protein YlxP (DUF503 family)
MVVGISTFELHLPACRSLKGKRKVVKGLIDRIHARFRVSVAETDFHDLRQRAEISVAIVSRSEHDARRMLDEIRTLVDGVEPDAFVTHWDPQILEAAP